MHTEPFHMLLCNFFLISGFFVTKCINTVITNGVGKVIAWFIEERMVIRNISFLKKSYIWWSSI